MVVFLLLFILLVLLLASFDKFLVVVVIFKKLALLSVLGSQYVFGLVHRAQLGAVFKLYELNLFWGIKVDEDVEYFLTFQNIVSEVC